MHASVDSPPRAGDQSPVSRRVLARRRDHPLLLAFGEERELPRRSKDDVGTERIRVQPGEVGGQTIVRHFPAPKRSQDRRIDALEYRHAVPAEQQVTLTVRRCLKCTV
jgi:hypothetical protein